MHNDPYSILGVDRNASEEDIKKAWKRLAMKHHPDRGGSDEKLAEINSAYDQIKNGKANHYNDSGWHGTSHNFTREDIEEILRHRHNVHDFFREGRFRHQMQVSISVPIAIKDAVLGGEKYLDIPVRGQHQTVKVTIPEGLMHGERIRYPQLVDGIDVVITYTYLPDKDWAIDQLNIIKREEVDIFDLITGVERDLPLIDDSVVRIKIPPKTQPGTLMRVRGKGLLSRINGTSRGDTILQINAKIPDDIPEPILTAIMETKG